MKYLQYINKYIIICMMILLLGCLNKKSGDLTLLTINYDHLVFIRSEISKSSPTYKEAYQRLIKKANIALINSCYSVTYKDNIPPSGNKKDFMSQATYWWPDSTKTDGLPYIRKDGIRNPEIDGNQFDDKRSRNMVDDVTTLALAWFYSGDNDYAIKATKLIDTWFLDSKTSMNPNLEFGQAIPGRVDGRGIGIIDTRNYIEIIDAVKLLQKSKTWNNKKTVELQKWFSEYLDWLLVSSHGKDERAHYNNHGSWYDVQVVSYADFVGKSELAKSILSESVKMRIDQQIDSLGRQPYELDRTRAYTYSVMNLQALIYLAKMGEAYGVDLWNYTSDDKGSIRAACEYLLPYVNNFNEWPYQQITSFKWAKMFDLIIECNRVFNQADYNNYIETIKKRIKKSNHLLISKF